MRGARHSHPRRRNHNNLLNVKRGIENDVEKVCLNVPAAWLTTTEADSSQSAKSI
jgi:hypothetical protein